MLTCGTRYRMRGLADGQRKVLLRVASLSFGLKASIPLNIVSTAVFSASPTSSIAFPRCGVYTEVSKRLTSDLPDSLDVFLVSSVDHLARASHPCH